MERLRKQIEGAINSVSAENGSNTPDFILAEYLTGCLSAFDRAVNAREKWYGRPEAARPAPPTIAELEEILNDPNPGTVQINPDGSVTTSGQKPAHCAAGAGSRAVEGGTTEEGPMNSLLTDKEMERPDMTAEERLARIISMAMEHNDGDGMRWERYVLASRAILRKCRVAFAK